MSGAGKKEKRGRRKRKTGRALCLNLRTCLKPPTIETPLLKRDIGLRLTFTR